jgi:hypothetical protein
MARTALLLLIPAGLCAPAAAAEPLTAEAAIDHYREVFEPVEALDCPKPASPDEIVVCGRPEGSADPNRLPLPPEREPGAPVALAGEAPTGKDALATASCLRLCYQPVMLNIIDAALTAKKIVEHILDPD